MAVTPPTRPSLKMIKTIAFMGGTREWSNRYFFTGDDPSDAEFSALTTLIEAQERTIWGPEVTAIGAVGYHAGSEIPVWSTTYSHAGTLTTTGTDTVPQDCAVVLRLGTDQRTSKNHPIYLFKYYHGARKTTGTDNGGVTSLQVTHVNQMGDFLVAGASDGTDHRQFCGPRGAVALNRLTNVYIRHRDFRV